MPLALFAVSTTADHAVVTGTITAATPERNLVVNLLALLDRTSPLSSPIGVITKRTTLRVALLREPPSLARSRFAIVLIPRYPLFVNTLLLHHAKKPNT